LSRSDYVAAVELFENDGLHFSMSNERSEPAVARPKLETLSQMFALQDQCQPLNRERASAEFVLIERGLSLAFDLTFWLNDDPQIVAKRKALPNTTAIPENVGANLLHAAVGSLVSATRLCMFGDFVDALSLARTAFEAVVHAEYFRDHPHRAAEWNQVGAVTDVFEIRKQLKKFEDKEHVRGAVRSKYSDKSHDRFFAELSTYGTHVNPKTVGLRMATPLAGAGNLGFVAAGYAEAPALCASHILHVLAYALSEFEDTFRDYLASNASLRIALRQFDSDYHTHQEVIGPRTLSLAKLTALASCCR